MILESITVSYPEGFTYWYTGMDTQILAPKKVNIPSITVIFSIADYVSFKP